MCKKQQCGFDEESCKKLNEWYTIEGKYVEQNKYIQSFEDIKECKPNDYITLIVNLNEQYKRIGITF